MTWHRLMTDGADGMAQIMTILGLPRNVTEFTLHTKVDLPSVVTVTYYPTDDPGALDGTVTKQFELKEIAQ